MKRKFAGLLFFAVAACGTQPTPPDSQLRASTAAAIDSNSITTNLGYLNGSGLPADIQRATLVDKGTQSVWSSPVMDGGFFQIVTGAGLNNRPCTLFLVGAQTWKIDFYWASASSPAHLESPLLLPATPEEVPVPDANVELSRVFILNETFISGEGDWDSSGQWRFPVTGYETVKLVNATQGWEKSTVVLSTGNFAFNVSPNDGDNMKLTFSGGTASGSASYDFIYRRPLPQQPLSLEALGAIVH